MRPICIFLLFFSACMAPKVRQDAANVACTCNGLAEDTACLQKAINENESIVFADHQTCTAREAIVIGAGKHIRGNGAKVKFDLNEEVNGFKMTGSQATLSGLKIEFHSRSKRNVKAPVWIGPDTNGIALLDNYIDAGGADIGIVSDSPNTKNVWLAGNTVENAAFGLLVNAHYSRKWKPEQYQSGWQIEKNIFRKIRGDAIEINSPNGGFVPKGSHMSNFKITDNELEAGGAVETGTGFCLGIAGLQGGVVTGNKMKDCKWQCVHVEDHASDILIQSNTCENVIGPKPTDKSSWQLDDSTGVLILGSAEKIKIYGNQVSRTAGAGIVVGVKHTGRWVEWHPSDIEVSGNTVTEAGTYGILVKAYPHHSLKTYVGPGGGFGANTVKGSKKKAFFQDGGRDVRIEEVKN